MTPDSPSVSGCTFEVGTRRRSEAVGVVPDQERHQTQARSWLESESCSLIQFNRPPAVGRCHVSHGSI